MAEPIDTLIKHAQEVVRGMTPEERGLMRTRQAKGFARSEARWPKGRFRIVDGVKVYDCYEDYCND